MLQTVNMQQRKFIFERNTKVEKSYYECSISHNQEIIRSNKKYKNIYKCSDYLHSFSYLFIDFEHVQVISNGQHTFTSYVGRSTNTIRYQILLRSTIQYKNKIIVTNKYIPLSSLLHFRS